ncbi:MAG: decarboxylase [Candidatus Aenigmarchaeota archaeon]|nr:decarboxylase [Candidatus Aenigmarchaeota archaeon]
MKQYEILKEYADEIVYSFKTNPVVGKVLESMSDCKFAICSFNSVDRIEDKSRIVYFLQGENEKEISIVLDKGVRSFVVDNENDLNRLLSILNKKKVKIELFLRVKVREHTIYTGKYFVYGISWKRANELISKLKENEYISTLGIHFHRKTQNVGEWFLKEDFEEIISEENRKLINKVNIGGGIPVEYVNSKPDVKFILRMIKEFKQFLNEEGIELVVEPGRFLAAPAIRLETEIINVYGDTIVVDASLFNGAMDVYLLGYRYPVVGEKEKGIKFLIKGRSPDSLDIFRYKVFFDHVPKVGDKIIFKNAGAYNFYTDFNDMPKIKTVIVERFEER